MKCIIFIFVVLFTLSGCYSKLHLRIESLDIAKFEKTDGYLQSKMKEFRNEALNSSQELITIKSELVKFVDDIALEVSRNVVPKQNSDEIKTAMKDLYSNINILTPEYLLINNTLDSIGIYENLSDERKKQSLFLNIKSLNEIRKNRIEQYISKNINAINTKLEFYSKFALSIKSKLEKDKYTSEFYQKVSKVQHWASFTGTTIYPDPASSIVVALSDDFWKKERITVKKDGKHKYKGKSKNKNAIINEVKVKTFLGNADVAVKMDTIGVFTIKAVRVDTRETMKATGIMLNLALKYMAFQAGVPTIGQKDSKSLISGIPSETDVAQKEVKLYMEQKNIDIQNYLISQSINDILKSELRANEKVDRLKAIYTKYGM